MINNHKSQRKSALSGYADRKQLHADAKEAFHKCHPMENIYRISLRYISETYDFRELIPKMDKYNVSYSKKGDNLTKSGSIKAKANVLVISDCFFDSRIDDDNNTNIINTVMPIIRILSEINTDDLKREIYITGAIEEQQFGISISLNLINFLAENKYSLSFSGISYS